MGWQLIWPPSNTIIAPQAIHWARLIAKTNLNTTTISTIPHEKWYENYILYSIEFANTYILTYFQSNTIQYYEPTIPPNLNKKNLASNHAHYAYYTSTTKTLKLTSPISILNYSKLLPSSTFLLHT